MNKTIFQDDQHNAIRISEFNAYHGDTVFNHVAAKFVVKGVETYLINDKKYQIRSGEYILGNNNRISEVWIRENTVGICVDIADTIIHEIATNVFDNPDLSDFILSHKLLINKYNAENTNLGHQLNRLSSGLLIDKKDELLNTEWFYSIGESIVHDQALVFGQFSKLRYKKQEVSEEVFANLLESKALVDDCFLQPLSLNKLAKTAAMSKYAFLRLFKTTFGFTPYQYILQKRLLFAKNRLLNGEKIADVALLAGFADTPSFSKAFKKHFGNAPSQMGK